MKNLILMLAAAVLCISAFAEGTKELKPTANDKGNLLIFPSYTQFGTYGAPEQNQMKVRITSTSETLYFGFNNINGRGPTGFDDNGTFVPNVPFRILSPSGQVVYSSVIPPVGQPGNVANWSQAVAGPKQLGNIGGYDALQLKPQEVGDYVIEFDPAAVNVTRLNINYFDVTVTNASNEVQLGRLHSQGWQISTQSYTNPFNGKVYPYDGSSAVYQVDFNGMQPFVFDINFNSTGTGNTGNFLVDRQSKIGNYTAPEYEVFLNPPDPVLYPTQKKEITLEGQVERKDCMYADFCLNFTTNSDGDLQGFIDLNGNGVYDPQFNEVFFQQHFSEPGTKCISWNGRDSKGNPVVGDFQVVASIGFGITHLPLYDVEHNRNGYKITVVRPEGATPPVIFWDDSKIVAGTALDGKVNLTGCVSADGGCHKWVNRGSINDASALDKQETINTWWYSSMAYTTMMSHIPAQHKVELSFHPTNLVQNDTTVCIGDSLNFYVYNDGYNHFNTSKFSYEWFFNNQQLTGDIRNQREQILGPSIAVVKATDRTALTCVSYDTLHIKIVNPVKLKATVIQPGCNQSTGSIQVQMTAGPPNKQFYWLEYPSVKTGTLSNVPKGTYHLTAKDPTYPQCGADTSFTIIVKDFIGIDTVKTTATLCYAAEGNAQVFMKAPTRMYEYSWDNSAFSSSSTASGLAAGQHTVVARDPNTGCTDKKVFVIPGKRIPVKATSQNEICHNGKGGITLNLPAEDFNITWNGVTDKETQKQNLSAGLYKIHVESAAYPACHFDTAITITNTTKKIVIKKLIVTPSSCANPAGTAELVMMDATSTYNYSWDNGPYGNVQKMTNLSAGPHTVQITDTYTTCVLDTNFSITGQPFTIALNKTNETCHSGNGTITVSADNGDDLVIKWNDISEPLMTRTDLRAGIYHFTLYHQNEPTCKIERTITITNTNYSLQADFDFQQVYDPNVTTGREIKFTNLSKNMEWSYWQFGDGTYSSDENPTHIYNEDKEYVVILKVVDTNGCYGEVQKSFAPFKVGNGPCGIALPNVFSPNKDNVNDDIGILGYAPKVELKIFNRWGEVIFRTFEIDKRWNGTYRNEDTPIGVYPYILDWECPEGDGKMVKRQKVGDITLVR